MSRLQFCSIHEPPALTLATTTTGSLTPGSLYFVLQGRNVAGYTIQSPSVLIAYQNRIEITIPSSAKQPGDEVVEWVISASPTNVAENFQVVCTVPGDTPLPTTVVLDQPSHIVLGGIVANSGALPTGSALKAGMRRYITEYTNFYEYDPDSGVPVDPPDVLVATIGRWVLCGGFSTYVESQVDPGGCDVDLRDIEFPETLILPEYAMDGSLSDPIRIMWFNDDNGLPLPQGTRMVIIPVLGGVNASNLLNGKLKFEFEGYVNPLSGIIDTADMTTGVIRDFNSDSSSFTLEKPCPDARGILVKIYLKFNLAELLGQAPSNYLSVFMVPSSRSGQFNEAGFLFGDLVGAEDDRLLVVPGAGLTCTMLSGSALVDSFSFRHNPAVLISGLVANTADQKIALDGNGAAYVRTGSIQSYEALRALVSTEEGEGALIDAGSINNVSATATLVLELDYPTTIRSDYPDKVAGVTGEFNPDAVAVYVDNGSEIRRYEFPAVAGATQTVSITAFNGAVVGSLPTAPDADFSLYQIIDADLSVTNSGGTIPAGTYSVSVCFVYDGGQVTKISHKESDGCIAQFPANLAAAFTLTQIIGLPVQDLTELRAIPRDQVFDYQERYVITLNRTYRFFPAEVGADDGDQKIKPSFVANDSLPGRFMFTGVELQNAYALQEGSTPVVAAGQMSIYNDNGVLKLKTETEEFSFAFLEALQAFVKAQAFEVVTLTDGANIALDMALGNFYEVTLGGNRTLDNPTNVVQGRWFDLKITQDSTGGRTLSLGANYRLARGATALELSADPDTYDVLRCTSYDGTLVHCTLLGGAATTDPGGGGFNYIRTGLTRSLHAGQGLTTTLDTSVTPNVTRVTVWADQDSLSRSVTDDGLLSVAPVYAADALGAGKHSFYGRYNLDPLFATQLYLGDPTLFLDSFVTTTDFTMHLVWDFTTEPEGSEAVGEILNMNVVVLSFFYDGTVSDYSVKLEHYDDGYVNYTVLDAGVATPVGSPVVITVRQTGGTLSLQINDNTPVTASVNAFGASDLASSTPYIGGYNDPSASGTPAAWLMYNVALAPGDIATNVAYLMNEYGIA